MTTASDIISRAAKAIGYLGRTEVLSAGDANDGLVAFNAMLDSFSNEFLMSYVRLERSFPLQVNKQTYTIGTTTLPVPDINATRPSNILSAFVRDSSQIDYPMTVVSQVEWNSIGQKNITSQIPDTLFYDPQFPLGVINIFPLPLLPYSVYYDSTLDQVDASTLVTAISMPVGYERLYVMNLALELLNVGFPNMLSESQFAVLSKNAAEAKANVKRVNMKEVLANYDPAIVSRSDATYNIYNDSSPRADH